MLAGETASLMYGRTIASGAVVLNVATLLAAHQECNALPNRIAEA